MNVAKEQKHLAAQHERRAEDDRERDRRDGRRRQARSPLVGHPGNTTSAGHGESTAKAPSAATKITRQPTTTCTRAQAPTKPYRRAPAMPAFSYRRRQTTPAGREALGCRQAAPVAASLELVSCPDVGDAGV